MTHWYARCAYDHEVKQRFHTAARARLRRLATTLGFPSGSFDLRSNPGGIAVSGEITLHHDDVYIQVCQPATGADSGILIRCCQGRRDYTGGRNHFAPLRLLDDTPTLAAQVRAVRRGSSDSLNQTGQQIVRRNLNIQPTLTIRPGFPVRVIVNRDLVLAPYQI